MTHFDWLAWALLGTPAIGSLLCRGLPSRRSLFGGVAALMLVFAGWTALLVSDVLAQGPQSTQAGWLYADALSALHLAILTIVFGLSSVYAWEYFRSEDLGIRAARRFASLWLGTLSALVLVLLSNNIGILWVGVEASTLLSAFLICLHPTAYALEATWKYLILCSVGVALAFLGTLLVAASAHALHLPPAEALLWTRLRAGAPWLDRALVKAGFLFLLVGYGTKVGLAPLHSWLPDAHSQAPAPVSAVFSGFLLNTALYCLLRYLPLVEEATQQLGWARQLLLTLGLLSISLAALFMVFQHDAKRLLAYSSVEHMGLVALGMGLGGLGVFAGLLHTVNHALGKTAAFFSAGRIGQAYNTHELSQQAGMLRCLPLWGSGFLLSVLALIGVAPFGIFISELLLFKAAIQARAWWTLGIMGTGLGGLFVAALRHLINVAWGDPMGRPLPPLQSWLTPWPLVLPLAALLLLGFWVPDSVAQLIGEAARIVRGSV